MDSLPDSLRFGDDLCAALDLELAEEFLGVTLEEQGGGPASVSSFSQTSYCLMKMVSGTDNSPSVVFQLTPGQSAEDLQESFDQKAQFTGAACEDTGLVSGLNSSRCSGGVIGDGYGLQVWGWVGDTSVVCGVNRPDGHNLEDVADFCLTQLDRLDGDSDGNVHPSAAPPAVPTHTNSPAPSDPLPDCPSVERVITAIGVDIEIVDGGHGTLGDSLRVCAWKRGQGESVFGLNIRAGTSSQDFADLKDEVQDLGQDITPYPGFGDGAFLSNPPGTGPSFALYARFGERIYIGSAIGALASVDRARSLIELMLR